MNRLPPPDSARMWALPRHLLLPLPPPRAGNESIVSFEDEHHKIGR